MAKTVFKGPGAPLVVSLVSFNVFRPYIKNGLSIDVIATQIAFLTVETILSWMASLTDDEQAVIVKNVKSDEKLIARFVTNFYLNRADHSRSNSSTETFELLATSAVGRATIWTEKRWDQVGAVVARLAGVFGKKYADIDIGDPAAFQKLIERQQGDGFHDPIYTLTRAVELSRIFGFTGVLVQIDKVDETDWTGSDIPAAADLILPILANIGLHEIGGLTWTFFVWDEVSRWMKINHRDKIRFDKIPNGEIEWEVNYLTDLVSRRMSYFSASRVNSLANISEISTDASNILNELIALTGKSPRKLISALDHVLSQHIQRNQGNDKKLDMLAFELGMDSYAIKSLREDNNLEEARAIAKIQLPSFVTKDVQGLLRQSAQSARARIEKWLEHRLVQPSGNRPTAGAGRPVDQFTVSDPRALRVLTRNL